jgi:hypothetical protein
MPDNLSRKQIIIHNQNTTVDKYKIFLPLKTKTGYLVEKPCEISPQPL